MMVRLAAGMCAAALLAGAPAQMASANQGAEKLCKIPERQRRGQHKIQIFCIGRCK